jgi:hypothetical protein
MKSYPLYQAYRAVLAFFSRWPGRAKPSLILTPNPLPMNGLLRVDVLQVARLSVAIEILTKESKSVFYRMLVPTSTDYTTAFRLPAGLRPGMYQVVVKVFGRPDERVWLALEEAELPSAVSRPVGAAPAWLKRWRPRLAPGRGQLVPALMLALGLSGGGLLPMAELHAQELSAVPALPPDNDAVWRDASAAPVTVSGHVVDERGLPMAGATVDVPGSRYPGSTNAAGNFLVTAYPKAGEQLVLTISYVGYLDVHLPVSSAFLNVALAPAPGAKKYRANAKVRRYKRHLKAN